MEQTNLNSVIQSIIYHIAQNTYEHINVNRSSMRLYLFKMLHRDYSLCFGSTRISLELVIEGIIDSLALIIIDSTVLNNILIEVDKGVFKYDRSVVLEYVLSMKKVKKIIWQKIVDIISQQSTESLNTFSNFYMNYQGKMFSAIKKALALFIYNYGGIKKSLPRTVLLALEGYSYDNPLLNKKELIRAFQWLEHDEIESIIEAISTLNLKNFIENQKKNVQAIRKRMQKNLLQFVIDLGAQDIKKGVDKHRIHIVQSLKALLNLINEWTQDTSIELYFSTVDNDYIMMRRLFDCIHEGTITINVITCPDYSGVWHSVAEGKRTIWKFTFEHLGSEDGFIARRAYTYVKQSYMFIKRYIAQVRINHILPTFEFFPNGFKSPKETLSYQECQKKLKQSLKVLRNEYKKIGLPVNLCLSNILISDEIFVQQKKSASLTIMMKYQNLNLWHSFIKSILEQRGSLYFSLYPRCNNESEDEYKQRITILVMQQLAEYYVAGTMCTQHRYSILLLSDSVLMYNAFAFYKMPVFFGKDANAADYTGG